MDEILIFLIIIAFIGVVLYFGTWILLALLVRVFSVVLMYWGITFVGSIMVGAVAGAVLPIIVFAGQGKAQLRQVAPPGLAEWTVIKQKPPSPNAEYGWDSAWPNYMPYQAKEDAAGVYHEALHHVTIFWNWSRSRIAAGEETSVGRPVRTNRFERGLLNVVWAVIILPTICGYFLGVWSTTIVWLIVMALVGLLVTGGQRIVCKAHVLLASESRRRLDTSVKCPYCYGKTTLPGYRCQNPDCDVVHWLMVPGPQGIFTRWCSCGVRLPNTVSGAAKVLVPVCPSCGRDLVNGSGVRQTVQLALVGSIGAGKSRLLDTAITELEKALESVGGSLTPLSADAELYFQQAVTRRQQASPTAKTEHKLPIGLTFLVQKGPTRVELQLMDAAGEAFANWDESAKLRYLDTAEALIAIIDPLALPRIRDHLLQSRYANSVLLANGDQEEAYAAAIDRLRAESIPLNKRGLAVVLTKGDVLAQLAVASSVDLTDSASIRQWLIDNDCDLMIKRFEKDFRDVRYFVIDSMSKQDIHAFLNPWWVIDWVLNEAKSPLRLGRQVMVPSDSGPLPGSSPLNFRAASRKRTEANKMSEEKI